MKEVRIDRDSVCAADDVDPHAEVIRVSADETFEALLRRISSSGYLASIAGGQATWVAEADGKPVAVIAQQWRKPEFLQSGSQTISQVLHFRYRAQADPWKVLREHSFGQTSLGRRLFRRIAG